MNAPGRSLLLASGSPRRSALLRRAGLVFEIARPDVDESPRPGEPPRDLARRLASAKAAAVARPDATVVLAADTIVVYDGVALGKPADADDAGHMLRRLAGRTHEVITAVAALGADFSEVIHVVTTVGFRPLRDAEITAYVATGEPMDKAGAYGIQGEGGAFTADVRGSYTNVVGLPLAETLLLLERAGVTR